MQIINYNWKEKAEEFIKTIPKKYRNSAYLYKIITKFTIKNNLNFECAEKYIEQAYCKLIGMGKCILCNRYGVYGYQSKETNWKIKYYCKTHLKESKNVNN